MDVEVLCVQADAAVFPAMGYHDTTGCFEACFCGSQFSGQYDRGVDRYAVPLLMSSRPREC